MEGSFEMVVGFGQCVIVVFCCVLFYDGCLGTGVLYLASTVICFALVSCRLGVEKRWRIGGRVC